MENKIKELEKSLDKEIKEINEGYDRIESKMKAFQDYLKQKDKEFKLMELEDKALELMPKLKRIKQ